MKPPANIPQKFNSISALHRALGFPKPMHPLISLVNYADITTPPEELPKVLLLDFYKISYKQNLTGQVKYGQGYYDFDEGGLSFVAPGQVIAAAEDEQDYAGHTLLIHPDFIRSYPLGAKIKTYGFFHYSVHEALFFSDAEKHTLLSVFDNIRTELTGRIDDFSQDVMVAHLEVLLSYSNRFYKRQFITRKAASHTLLTQVEQLLSTYFSNDETLKAGLPTVEYLAGKLGVSPRYLTDMLRTLTGQTAQQHIHEKLMETAKEHLAATALTVAEIAYHLGFEHPQSFNKVFKKKTGQSPLAYRQSIHNN